MMRKMIFVLFILVFVLAGCLNQQPGTSTPPAVSVAATLLPTPSPVTSETPTMPSDTISEETIPSPEASIPAGDEGAEERGIFKKMKVEKGDWVYYADWKKMAYIGEGYECPIKRIKKDGSNDTDLGITGFDFVLAGEYIYVSNNLGYGDFGHWDTVRMDLDGGNKKQLDKMYDDMQIKVYDGRIFFDTFNEGVLYTADSACENVTKYEVKLPDEGAIKQKLGDNYSYAVYMLNIKDVKGGWIYFCYGLVDTDQTPFYEGHYRMSLDGKTVEKTDKGKYNEELIKAYNN